MDLPAARGTSEGAGGVWEGCGDFAGGSGLQAGAGGVECWCGCDAVKSLRGNVKIRTSAAEAKFDIRPFHDEMINGGILPLDLLEARTERWIAEQKSK